MIRTLPEQIALSADGLISSETSEMLFGPQHNGPIDSFRTKSTNGEGKTRPGLSYLNHGHSLTPSLPPSLPHFLPHSLTPSLTQALSH